MAGKLGADIIDGVERSMLVAGETHEQKPVVIASGEVRSRGTVLGMITADNQFKILNPAATDGTEIARCILAEDVDATAAAARAEAHFIGKYRLSDLKWPSGITEAQKKTALTQLQDRGIIVDQVF